MKVKLQSHHDIPVIHYYSLKSQHPGERSLSATNYNLAIKSFCNKQFSMKITFLFWDIAET